MSGKPETKQKEVEGQSEFSLVKNMAEWRRLLIMSSEKSCKTIFWFDDRKHVIRTRLCLDNELKKYIEIELPDDLDRDEWEKKLAERESDHCYVIVFTKEPSIVGFDSSYMELHENRIRVQLPEQVYRAQRRKNYRFSIPAGKDITINIADPKDLRLRVRKRLLDISTGGISFLVESESEMELYKENMLIRNALMRIRGQVVAFDGEVRQVSKVTHDPRIQGYRVGVRFRRIRKEDLEFVDIYVIENAIQYFHNPY